MAVHPDSTTVGQVDRSRLTDADAEDLLTIENAIGMLAVQPKAHPGLGTIKIRLRELRTRITGTED